MRLFPASRVCSSAPSQVAIVKNLLDGHVKPQHTLCVSTVIIGGWVCARAGRARSGWCSKGRVARLRFGEGLWSSACVHRVEVCGRHDGFSTRTVRSQEHIYKRQWKSTQQSKSPGSTREAPKLPTLSPMSQRTHGTVPGGGNARGCVHESNQNICMELHRFRIFRSIFKQPGRRDVETAPMRREKPNNVKTAAKCALHFTVRGCEE